MQEEMIKVAKARLCTSFMIYVCRIECTEKRVSESGGEKENGYMMSTGECI